MSEQDYIPGTCVIKNLIRRTESSPYGSPDPRVLAEAENFYVSTRIAELRTAPIAGTFTFGHMRAIHKHLFQDVYAWAGEPRNVPMTKQDTAYASPTEMPALLREQYTRLAAEHRLRGINDRAEFTRKLAGYWGEINHGHAFREGNTRTQTVFFEQLAEHAGWKLDVARLSPHHAESVYQDFVDARFEHQRVRGTGTLSAQEAASELANVLGQLIEPDPSAECCRRRGVPLTEPTSQATATVARLRARSPELRNMKLDPYGLDEEPEQDTSTESGFQP
ncbi:Fic/DOC family protein [Cryobacterium zhongshanensis]|uniref:protein adenylyltransferase n=1 Tax=Cryobacterium zhongshanensis TaxID=2928153 RepID=A0AA41QXV9_9MICO|nr:Fic family protein [Cryobacterium zhongshanensis]MCI4659681.1 Fic family protein [Cryobacterium zhongshanensis]